MEHVELPNFSVVYPPIFGSLKPVITPVKSSHLFPARYRPQDWDQAACRKRLGDAKELGHAQKLQALKEIYENVKPVRTSGPVSTLW